MRMHNPPHPGEILHDLWIEPLGLSITATAGVLNVSRKTVSEIINGRAGITAEMAMRLELAFGKSAQSWMNHQASYDLAQVQARAKTLGVHHYEAA